MMEAILVVFVVSLTCLKSRTTPNKQTTNKQTKTLTKATEKGRKKIKNV